MDAEERVVVLEEMVRLGERTIDQQIAAMDVIRGKNESAISLALTILGASPVALGLLTEAQAGAVGTAPLVVFGTGAALVFLAVALLLHSGLLRPTSAQTGPHPTFLDELSDDRTWTREEMLHSLVGSFPDYYHANLQKMEESIRWRRNGVYVLVAGVVVLASGLLLIVLKIG